MMERQTPDQDVRDLYLRNAPAVGDDEIWGAIKDQLPSKRRRPRARPLKRKFLVLSLATVAVLAAVAFSVYQAVSYLNRPSPISITDDQTAKNLSKGQEVLERSLGWIEAAPTQVTFGAYTLTYGKSAKVAELELTRKVSGEPLIWGTWWWQNDDDYYFDDTSVPRHLTPQMVMSMKTATYPGATTGVAYLVIVRFSDPHRLLALSEVTSTSEQPDGSWKLELEASVHDVVGLDLSDTELSRIIGPTRVLKTSLDVGPDGSIRSMSVTRDTPGTGAVSYAFTRTNQEVTLPSTWLDLDTYTRQSALATGWRASLADAAKDVNFPLYSLGNSYDGLPLGSIHVVEGEGTAVLFGYYEIRLTTAVTQLSDRYLLFEYSESNVPQSEQRYVANKTLIKTAGEGDDAYFIYKTARGAPGRSILIRKGQTYIAIDWEGIGTGDATEQLLAAAADLQKVEP